MVAHTLNPNTQEADVSGALNSRPACSIQQVQPRSHRETLSQKPYQNQTRFHKDMEMRPVVSLHIQNRKVTKSIVLELSVNVT